MFFLTMAFFRKQTCFFLKNGEGGKDAVQDVSNDIIP